MLKVTATIEIGLPVKGEWKELREYLEDARYHNTWFRVHPDEQTGLNLEYLFVAGNRQDAYFISTDCQYCGGSVGPCNLGFHSDWPTARVQPLAPGERVSFVIGNDADQEGGKNDSE